MKILLIDSDQVTVDSLNKQFKKTNFRCEVANSLQAGYRKVINFEYDCILIDPKLRGGDGMRLLPAIREEETNPGVIILSDLTGVNHKVAALIAGADDYLTKPFNMAELMARIKAVTRRKSGNYKNYFSLGRLEIRLEERTASVDGIPIPFTKKEFDILLFLARNRNRVVTKESIAEHLWGDHMDEAPSFDFIYAHLKNLRKKLEGVGCKDYIKTMYGLGYKFEII